MTFKPMLASECTDTSKLDFPVFASHKLDGVRATMQGGVLLSRSLKPIPNKIVQQMFRNVPEGVDGELIFGDPRDSEAYRKTVSVVMSQDKPGVGVSFHVFDMYKQFTPIEPFTGRFCTLFDAIQGLSSVLIVAQEHIDNEEDLLAFEAAALADGHEGVMIRSMMSPYKQGRSTEKEGYLLKLKRFCDSEAEVIGVEEKMHNANEARTNELGRTERSSHKAGLVGTGELGALLVRDLKSGVEFGIGSGYTGEQRKLFWASRSSMIGETVKYKFFPTGSKDKPRFPVFIGIRDPKDMS